jgi:hypothetical protein
LCPPIGDLHRSTAASREPPRVARDYHRRCPPADLHDRRQLGTVTDHLSFGAMI